MYKLKIAFIFMFLILFYNIAYAKNYYVRPESGGYGSENGSDWNNAFDGFADIDWGDIGGGDTIWVAGGTYREDLDIGASGTNNSARLVISRADPNDPNCTSVAGWQAGFDSRIIQTNGANIDVGHTPRSYVTVSGRVWQGWKVEHPQGADGISVENTSGTCYGLIFQYIWAEGSNTYNFTSHTRNADITPKGSVEGMTIQYCDFEKGTSEIYLMNVHNSIIQWNYLHDTDTDGHIHENTIYMVASNGNTIRYNKMFKNGVEGVFYNSGCDNNKIYGNIAYNQCRFFKANKSGATGNLIYNNTIHLKGCTGGGGVIFDGSGYGSGNKVMNNLFFIQARLADNGATHDYNWAYNSDHNAPNSIDGNGTDPFKSSGSPSWNYILDGTTGSKSPRDNGKNLGEPYDFDGLSNFSPVPGQVVNVKMIKRGKDGAWDIGAYEYDSGGIAGPPPPQIPGTPQNLAIIGG